MSCLTVFVVKADLDQPVPEIHVEEIRAKDTYRFRKGILIYTHPEMVLNNHPESRHYGLVLNSKILGVGSCGPQRLEGDPGLRLCAMALVPELRWRGLWHLLHEACITRAE